IGRESWLWIALILGGAAVACWMQREYKRGPDKNKTHGLVSFHQRDLALFCVVSLLLGGVGYVLFLIKLRYWTQTWYYFELLCLCVISLDGIVGIGWPRLRPWGWIRIGFVIIMMIWYAPSAWSEAHTRRSNVDLIAAVLNEKATPEDLIVVNSAWEG